MKGLIVGALALLIAGGTTYTVVSMNNETASGNAGDTPVAEQVNTEESIQPPTERTVDIQGYPWEYLGYDQMSEEINTGGQVFLLSDAERLESKLIGFANYDYPETKEFTQGEAENGTKKKSADGWANVIDYYVEDLKEFYPDNEEYFNKINEIADSLRAEDYDSVVTKTEEAKQLRLQ